MYVQYVAGSFPSNLELSKAPNNSACEPQFSSVACDGEALFLFDGIRHNLHKIGSGFHSTLPGEVTKSVSLKGLVALPSATSKRAQRSEDGDNESSRDEGSNTHRAALTEDDEERVSWVDGSEHDGSEAHENSEIADHEQEAEDQETVEDENEEEEAEEADESAATGEEHSGDDDETTDDIDADNNAEVDNEDEGSHASTSSSSSSTSDAMLGGEARHITFAEEMRNAAIALIEDNAVAYVVGQYQDDDGGRFCMQICRFYECLLCRRQCVR